MFSDNNLALRAFGPEISKKARSADKKQISLQNIDFRARLNTIAPNAEQNWKIRFKELKISVFNQSKNED